MFLLYCISAPPTMSNSKEVAHYVVTAHPPGSVRLTAKCNFLSENSLVSFSFLKRKCRLGAPLLFGVDGPATASASSPGPPAPVIASLGVRLITHFIYAIISPLDTNPKTRTSSWRNPAVWKSVSSVPPIKAARLMEELRPLRRRQAAALAPSRRLSPSF